MASSKTNSCIPCIACPEIISGECVTYDGTGISGLNYPDNPTIDQMIYVLGNQLIQIQTNESIIISDDFINIGYNSNELTYTYDISDLTYPDVFWIIVGENYEYVGEVTSQEELLTYLNNTGLGVFTVQDDILSVTGYAIYGELFSVTSEEVIPDSALLIDTSDPQTMLNIYGSTAFDISIEHSIVGNTALINNIKALNFKFLAYPSGAVINWLHYVDPPGDQWNAIEQDAIDRGKDWQTAQGGDLYNGGIPYGREFYEEYRYLIDQLEITEAVIGINMLMPLIPYSNQAIPWSIVDYDSLKDEFDIALDQLSETNATCTILELGMEDITNAFADLTANPGGGMTKEEVIKKLLTYGQDETPSFESLIEHFRAALPDAIISIDGRLWDDNTNHDPDWNVVLSAIPQVDVVRQYYQFYDPFCINYETARAKVAARVNFWNFIEDADFNGKGVFLSQFEMKALNPVRATVAQGLIIAEMYLKMTEENLQHSDKLVGMCLMNFKQLFAANSGYTTKPHYPFVKQLGGYFENDQELLSITSTNSTINNTLIMQAIRVDGDTLRVAVINPSSTAYTLSSLSIDNTPSVFTVTQVYCNDPLNPLTDASILVTESVLNFRPYSLSIITFPAP